MGPTTFAPNQVIKGWTEAMQLMVAGDKWEMYISSEMGYGERGSPPKIPGGSVLVFVMEIIEILGDDKVPAMRCKLEGADLKPSDSCNERETKFVEKVKNWDLVKVGKEIERLDSMKGDKMKAELIAWIQRRAGILQQVKQIRNEKT